MMAGWLRLSSRTYDCGDRDGDKTASWVLNPVGSYSADTHGAAEGASRRWASLNKLEAACVLGVSLGPKQRAQSVHALIATTARTRRSCAAASNEIPAP